MTLRDRIQEYIDSLEKRAEAERLRWASESATLDGVADMLSIILEDHDLEEAKETQDA